MQLLCKTLLCKILKKRKKLPLLDLKVITYLWSHWHYSWVWAVGVAAEEGDDYRPESVT